MMATKATVTKPDPEPSSIQIQTTAEGITTVTINRPHRRNAVDGPTALKLFNAFTSFENDATQKICILHGSNGTFCAGADLQEVAKISEPNNTASSSDSERSKSSQLLPVDGEGKNPAPMGPSRMQLSKPLICAVSGHAVAGGLELSLLGDLRVVEEDAIFGVFCRRFGVPLIDGGTVRLQRIVGLGRAMDMILTGRPVSAQEALRMGLATRVVPKDYALDEAMKLAQDLLRFPSECMKADRRSVYHAAYQAKSFRDALAFEFGHGVPIVRRESVQGAARFTGGEGRHGKFAKL
jgi:enoyl-CoA hydratase/carnithine racemase